jgi:hypothetical protein
LGFKSLGAQPKAAKRQDVLSWGYRFFGQAKKGYKITFFISHSGEGRNPGEDKQRKGTKSLFCIVISAKAVVQDLKAGKMS